MQGKNRRGRGHKRSEYNGLMRGMFEQGKVL